jgi:phosphoribosyl 1,2-cyclic phosphate phosphodiesterase
MMKLQYLGTAAAEGIPALFCQCPLCMQSRELKGKDIRGRSGMMVDGRLMIDFPPDILTYAVRFGFDLAKVKHLFVTHSHSDHFAPADLVLRMPKCYCTITDGEPVLYVYGNREVIRLTEEALRREYRTDRVDFLRTELLEPYRTVQAGDYEVTPLPAAHKPDEQAFFYLVRKGQTCFLYAHDTGIFPSGVFDYLRRTGTVLDMVSLDCTFCVEKEGTAHMGFPDLAEILGVLRKSGVMTEKTLCIANHFSHNGGMTHSQLEEEARKCGLSVAYDGMRVDLTSAE